MRAVLILSSLIFCLKSFAVDTGAKIKVNGMVCSFCTSSIEKKFKENKEVADVSVDLDSKTVLLKYVPDKDLQENQIKDIITKAGYNVVSIEHESAATVPVTKENSAQKIK